MKPILTEKKIYHVYAEISTSSVVIGTFDGIVELRDRPDTEEEYLKLKELVGSRAITPIGSRVVIKSLSRV